MVRDFAGALSRGNLAFALAREDLGQKVQFSALGPLWLFIQPLLWMVAFVILLRPSEIAEQHSYALYVALGIVIFHSIQTMVGGGAQVFVRERNQILNVPLPLSLYVLKNLIVGALEIIITAPIVIGTMVFVPPQFGPAMLAAIPGFVILFSFVAGTTLALGTLTARLPDVGQMTQAAMRMLYFLTPVFWQPNSIGGVRHIFADVNPLYYILLVVRGPLMGEMPSVHEWVVATATAADALVIGIIVFARYRHRIAVWI